MSKRSQQKRVTKANKALRYMRQTRGLSLNQAGRRYGVTGSAVAHLEHGRMDLPPARVETMVKAYGFTMDEFNTLVRRDEVPLNKRDECLAIIRHLDEGKVSAVYGLLVNFAS